MSRWQRHLREPALGRWSACNGPVRGIGRRGRGGALARRSRRFSGLVPNIAADAPCGSAPSVRVRAGCAGRLGCPDRLGWAGSNRERDVKAGPALVTPMPRRGPWWPTSGSVSSAEQPGSPPPVPGFNNAVLFSTAADLCGRFTGLPAREVLRISGDPANGRSARRRGGDRGGAASCNRPMRCGRSHVPCAAT